MPKWASLVMTAIVASVGAAARSNIHQYSAEDLKALRSEVSAMFHRAYQGYLDHAFPLDELRPLSCDGVDTWGSYSLTLIDALDTLAVMGNYTEFSRVYHLVTNRTSFDANISVSVFETNIRIVGGLLSGHLMARRAGVDVEPGWPCDGPLLRLAQDAATRLLPAFDTNTGMPYGTVNLRHGVPEDETPVTCVAGVATFIVEFGALSRLTGNPVFEETAMRAIRSLWYKQSPLGLFGNHIDVQTGEWTATDAGIGAGVDSFFEYLVKGAALLQRPELMKMFTEAWLPIEKYLNHDGWYFWVAMQSGLVTMPVFQSLEAFWPGILSLAGDDKAARKSMLNYHQVWKQFGFLPEFYNVPQSGATKKREGYPLRPELAESSMYLFRATRDPFWLKMGEDMLRSIQHSAVTECGYATIKNVKEHLLEDRMESFFLAETTKYLYLLFDTENFIHNSGNTGTVVNTNHGECIVDTGGYVFNSEAHPIDAGALQCCHSHTLSDVRDYLADNLVDVVLDPTVLFRLEDDVRPRRAWQVGELQRASKEGEGGKLHEEQPLHQGPAATSGRPDGAAHGGAGETSPEDGREETEVDGLHAAKDEGGDEGMSSSGKDPQGSTLGPEEDSGKQKRPLGETTPSTLNKIKTVLMNFLDFSSSKSFDRREFAMRVTYDRRFDLDYNWSQDYAAMHCLAPTFPEKFSLQGEYLVN